MDWYRRIVSRNLGPAGDKQMITCKLDCKMEGSNNGVEKELMEEEVVLAVRGRLVVPALSIRIDSGAK